MDNSILVPILGPPLFWEHAIHVFLFQCVWAQAFELRVKGWALRFGGYRYKHAFIILLSL